MNILTRPLLERPGPCSGRGDGHSDPGSEPKSLCNVWLSVSGAVWGHSDLANCLLGLGEGTLRPAF